MAGEDTRRPEEVPAQSAFSDLCGIRVVTLAADLVVLEMPVTADLTNRNGVLHGGALMTLADSAAGTAAFVNIAAERSNTTLEAKTNFLRGVRLGDTVRAHCVPLHRDDTILVLEVTTRRGDGKIAAVTTQTHMVLDWKG